MIEARRDRWLGWGLLAVIAVTLVSTATWNSGYNSDQQRVIDTQRAMVRSLEYTQPDHTWNGVAYLPGILVTLGHLAPELPTIVVELAQGPTVPLDVPRYPTLHGWQTEMYRLMGTEQYKIEMRRVYMALTLPALLFVFLTVLRLFPGRHVVAAGAAGLVGLSWHVSMHARWTEVDGPMMMGTALALYLLCCALTVRTRQEGTLTAIGLGAAVGWVLGCKVSGIWLVIPSVAALLQMRFWRGWRDRALLVLVFGLALVMVYATISPESWRDPLRVLNHGFFQVRDYRSIGERYPYYVEPPFDHLWMILRWLFTVQPSASPWLAGVLSLATLTGIWGLARQRRRFAITAAIYPVLFLFFMSRLPLFQLRNYLQLVPFAAVAFGAGLITLSGRAPKPWMRRALAAVVGGIFLFNAGWLAYADHDMRTTTRDTILAEVREHLRESPREVLVSQRLYREVHDTLEEGYACTRNASDAEPGEADVLMYYMDHNAWHWRAVAPGWVDRYFAPLENDWHWSTLFKGTMEQHRVVLLPEDHAREMRVPLYLFQRCTPR